ncbi:F-box/kelch-repeat protein At3g06240-like [Quercus suber]|uniref:F-box/kelch-repeat protein At3g06240-like n=1 Tax=Quercus suber TaxID=58331 RepID=UPI000CE25F69|nr:F-box/kelch-repeat protein At3g06240-like [Quercus suber]XP_023923941.1 F-box/kelch-repeat protein At3g06240-like [Quercus suber]
MGMKKHRFFDMIGCINGIICFGGYLLDGFHGFVLWHPEIRNCKTVRYPLLADCAAHLPSSKPFKTYHAFGYDQYSNDYKVARIVTYHKLDTSTRTSFFTDYHNFFHVYSLNADFWTQIIDTAIHHSNIRLFSRFKGFYFNGVHYWNGFLDYGDTNELRQACDCEIVLAFDMSRDVF